MLTMNALEPVNYMQTMHGLVVEFCMACDSKADDHIIKCKELMDAYGYKQAKVGKHTYNITDKVLILEKDYVNTRGENEWLPINVLAYYVRTDSDYTKEEIDAERRYIFTFYNKTKYPGYVGMIKCIK